MSKVAIITGITGQDGSYLAELLLEKGYEIHGIVRRSSSFNTGRIEHLYIDELIKDVHKGKKIDLHYGDMTDSSSIIRIIRVVQPDEIYNLAVQPHVKISFEVPEYTGEVDALGTLRLLEAVRLLGLEKKTKISSVILRTLRSGTGDTTKRDNAFLSKKSVRCGKNVCFLDREKLPRGLWHVRM